MDEHMQALAAEAARQLLQDYRAAHPGWTDDSTPVDELAAWFGLEIATFDPDDYPRGTYGFLEPEEDLIWLCRGLPQTLRRFTLAHELGHAVLHRRTGLAVPSAWTLPSNQESSSKDACQTLDVREEVTELLYQEQAEEVLGIGLAYDPRSQRELAANIFAAELLMPLARL